MRDFFVYAYALSPLLAYASCFVYVYTHFLCLLSFLFFWLFSCFFCFLVTYLVNARCFCICTCTVSFFSPLFSVCEIFCICICTFFPLISVCEIFVYVYTHFSVLLFCFLFSFFVTYIAHAIFFVCAHPPFFCCCFVF